MKSIYLLSTRLWVYLTEIPVLIMLGVSISTNHLSNDIFKYYPLIIFLSFTVIFIMVYFFSVISINYEEIRYHGLFSSKDSAFITANKSLIIKIKPRRKLNIELYEDAGSEPAFEWMKAEDVIHREICIFRGKANGSHKTAGKILKYFGLDEEKLTDATTKNGYYHEDDIIKVTSCAKNEVFEITLKFKTTTI